MNALVRKEVRLVLPAWIGAMVLAIFPVWFVLPGEHSLYFIWQRPGLAVFAPFALGALLLGLASFAQELNFGTFSILLAQPVSRRHIWRVKTSVLAVALVLVFISLCLSLYVHTESGIETLKATDLQNALRHPATETEALSIIAGIRRDIWIETVLMGGICTLASFASGLWTNLLFRNTSAAFWFSLLVPLGLGLLGGKLFEGIGEVGLLIPLGLYSVAGYVWAKRLFLDVQDTQWTGGIISLPSWLGLKTGAGSAAQRRGRKPWRALIRKEFQSHQINFIIAGLLLLSHLIVIVVRRMSVDYFYTHRSVAMAWESWPLLWLVMPLLIGGSTVAEERKLGTMESLLCLPVTRRREFVVKFVMALFLGMWLGGLMPLLIERLGVLIGLANIASTDVMHFNSMEFSLVSVSLLGSAGLTMLSFYASTLTRNSLQALGLALVLTVLAGGVCAIAVNVGNLGFDMAPLWQGPLISFIGWPVMIVTLLALAYGNFKQLHVGSKIWRRNCVVALGSLAGVAALTTIIYHRAWELWLPEEPAHRYYGMNDQQTEKRLTTTPKITTSDSGMATILPRGRLWLRQRPVEPIQMEDHSGHMTTVFRVTGPQHEGFVAGSNWRDVARSDASCYAIQADGSLWDLSEVQPEKTGSEFGPKPFGTDRDWGKISGGRHHFVALKSDGTLWEWGRKFKTSGSTVAREKIMAPTQVGNDADWIAVGGFWDTSVMMKSDGSIWRFGVTQSIYTNNSLSTKTVEQPERWLSFEHREPVSMSLNGQALAVTCKDGTLWIGGILPFGLVESNTTLRTVHDMVRWGHDSDWREVQLNGWGGAIGIKKGGSLWHWNRDMLGYRMDWVIQPTMQSHYWNWVAACPYDYGSFLALNGDGQLCLWGDPSQRFGSYYWSDPSLLLQPSRIKARTIAELQR